MAGKDTPIGMQSDERHVYGPRPISRLVPRLTRPVFRRRAPATAQVLADWTAIMGPALASATTPVRLSAGTLTIACAGPIAMELQHLSNEVRARINTHLGRDTVKALRFVQTRDAVAPLGAPLDALQPVPDPARLAHVDAALEATLGELPQSELRSALASLGRALAVSAKAR